MGRGWLRPPAAGTNLNLAALGPRLRRRLLRRSPIVRPSRTLRWGWFITRGACRFRRVFSHRVSRVPRIIGHLILNWRDRVGGLTGSRGRGSGLTGSGERRRFRRLLRLLRLLLLSRSLGRFVVHQIQIRNQLTKKQERADRLTFKRPNLQTVGAANQKTNDRLEGRLRRIARPSSWSLYIANKLLVPLPFSCRGPRRHQPCGDVPHPTSAV